MEQMTEYAKIVLSLEPKKLKNLFHNHKKCTVIIPTNIW